jgi:hypothetical protein
MSDTGRLTTLWASTTCYRDTFTVYSRFSVIINIITQHFKLGITKMSDYYPFLPVYHSFRNLKLRRGSLSRFCKKDGKCIDRVLDDMQTYYDHCKEGILHYAKQ